MKNLFFLSLFLHLLLHSQLSFSQIVERGHSHNDYKRRFPLRQALDGRLRSLEIDVFAHKNRLVVSHNRWALDTKKDIQTLYLKPLQDLIRKQDGVVYPGDTLPLILMIDFKTGADTTYNLLVNVLSDFDSLICKYVGDSIVYRGPLDILISGNRPLARILTDSLRIANLDGTLNHLSDSFSVVIMPRISTSWKKHFTWNGIGGMPKMELLKLRKMVEKVNSQGRQLRIYGAPDNFSIWKLLLSEGVYWINTDNPQGFSRFYTGVETNFLR